MDSATAIINDPTMTPFSTENADVFMTRPDGAFIIVATTLRNRNRAYGKKRSWLITPKRLRSP